MNFTARGFNKIGNMPKKVALACVNNFIKLELFTRSELADFRRKSEFPHATAVLQIITYLIVASIYDST